MDCLKYVPSVMITSSWVFSRSRTARQSIRLVFFFQAEDGIRDLTVTGVQTCALPIFRTCSGSRCGWSRIVHLLLALSIGSCSRPASIKIAVVFSTTWAFESLNEADQAVVKRAALDTLRQAFDGFDVVFAETAAGDRTIRIEDTPYASNPGQLISFGAAGVTYPAAMVSSVHDDVLFGAELAAVRCPKVNECTKTRTELFEALGTAMG